MIFETKQAMETKFYVRKNGHAENTKITPTETLLIIQVNESVKEVEQTQIKRLTCL